jgi:hypothetical protein
MELLDANACSSVIGTLPHHGGLRVNALCIDGHAESYGYDYCRVGQWNFVTN